MEGFTLGPISSLSFFGQKMIIVNSAKVASDFSQRGSVYEDRPTVPMAGGRLRRPTPPLLLLTYFILQS